MLIKSRAVLYGGGEKFPRKGGSLKLRGVVGWKCRQGNGTLILVAVIGQKQHFKMFSLNIISQPLHFFKM